MTSLSQFSRLWCPICQSETVQVSMHCLSCGVEAAKPKKLERRSFMAGRKAKKPSQVLPSKSRDYGEMEAELWIARRLAIREEIMGVSTREQRIARIADTIVRRNLQDVVAGRKDGVPETWGRFFARIYRQPLPEPQIRNGFIGNIDNTAEVFREVFKPAEEGKP